MHGRFGLIWCEFPSSGDTKAQIFHSDQVVGCGMEVKLPGNLLDATVHGFAHPADGLHPAKAFFDPFPDSLADGVVRMVDRSAVNGRLSVGVVLCHMRRDLELAQFFDKWLGVVALIAA